MRCLACQAILTPFEESRNYHGTKIPLELCGGCSEEIKDDLLPTDDDITALDDFSEVDFDDY